ncbi:MAG: hypothetical protein PF436_14620, partial [Prolixibacteraceae bacterium]|nr:hypothetical protein [Prolixibacteraceae bacterium]
DFFGYFMYRNCRWCNSTVNNWPIKRLVWPTPRHVRVTPHFWIHPQYQLLGEATGSESNH